MARLLGKIIGGIINMIMVPFVLIIAVPMGLLKARRSASARLLFTGEEQSLLAKAQRTINMDSSGLLSPDNDLLEVAQFIEESRINYQTIKGRERYDATFSEFLRPRLSQCHVLDWENVIDFYQLSVNFSFAKNKSFDVDIVWKEDLCDWLNRLMTVNPDEMTSEDMFRVVKGNFQPSTIAEVQCLVLGDAQGGRGVAELPENLFQLRALKSLHLQRNNITQLSENLGQLCNLEELKLGGNSFRTLPAAIGKLTKLRILTLWWNDEFVALPPQIGELIELEGLDISACPRLIELPREITKLGKLKRLYLPSHGNLKLTSEQQEWIITLRLNGAEVERYW